MLQRVWSADARNIICTPHLKCKLRTGARLSPSYCACGLILTDDIKVEKTTIREGGCWRCSATWGGPSRQLCMHGFNHKAHNAPPDRFIQTIRKVPRTHMHQVQSSANRIIRFWEEQSQTTTRTLRPGELMGWKCLMVVKRP